MREICKKELKELLRKLETDCEEITIIIQSGEKCCKQTGCICDISDSFVILVDSDGDCQRNYISLDCICAITICDRDDCEEDECGRRDDCEEDECG
ncbi:hypothetical protein, partial [Halanaerobaculum tunisiense]